MAFKMELIADVAKFIRGTADVEKSLDDVADALDDIGQKDVEVETREAAKKLRDLADDAKESGSDMEQYFDAAADEVEASLKGLAKDADTHLESVETDAKTAAEKLESTFAASLKEVRDDSKTTGDDIGKELKRGTDDAGTGFDELKGEAASTAREAAASFDGSAESIADGFQEVAANAFAGFGPAGAAAGLALAAGIGIAMAKLQEIADRINEMKEEAGAIAVEMAEAGTGLAGRDLAGEFRTWSTEIQDVRSWFEVWQDDAVNNIEAVTAAGEKAGVDLGDVWGALNSPDIDAARGKLDEYTHTLELLTERKNTLNAAATSAEDYAEVNMLSDKIDGYQTLVDEMTPVIEQREKAEEIAREMVAAENDVSVAVVEQAEALRATTEAQAALGEERATAIDTTRSLFDAETSYAEQLASTVEAIGTNTDGMNANTEQGRTNRDALLELSGAARDQATAMAEAGSSATEVSGYMQSARTDFINAATAAGVGADEANRLADELMGVPDQVATDVTTTAKAAQSDTTDYITEVGKVPATSKTDVKVTVSPILSILQEALNAAARSVTPPTITYPARIGQARAV